MPMKFIAFMAPRVSIVAVNMDRRRVLTLPEDYCDTPAISASSLN
jgi:hypothetical protein